MNSVMPGSVRVTPPVKARSPSRRAISGRNGAALAASPRNGFMPVLIVAGWSPFGTWL